MVRIVAEVGFGSTVTTPAASITWTDITQYVDLRAGIAISRGRQDEQAEVQAGTMTLALDNSDGRFTPGRASSPYYPNVRKNVPIRLRVITTAKNLMPNPGFESGVSAWTSSGTPTRAASATHVHDGTQAMLITWGAAASQTVTSPVIHGLQVGQRYTYSTYVWVPAGHATVQLSVAGGNIGSANTLFDQFQRISVSWTATATSAQVRVRAVGTPAAGNQTWVDAGQIEEAAAATAYDSDGAQEHARFWGMVNAWPVQWTGLQAKASITCTDMFKRLARAPELRTMLAEEVLLDEPLAYYPLTEPSDATSAGDLSGTTAGPLTISAVGSGGEIAFSGEDAGPDGLGAVTLTPATISNGYFLASDLGQDYETRSRLAYVFHEFWFSTTTTGRVILGLTSDDNRYQIVYSLSAGGQLTVETTANGGALVGYSAGPASLADGQPHHVVYDELSQRVWIDGVSYVITADLMVGLRYLTVGAFTNSRLWSGTVSHVALYAPDTPALSSYVGHYTTGTTGHVGETGSARAARLAGYVGATVTASGGTFDGIGSQAALGSSPLAHLQEVERTEGGVLIAARDSSSIVLQSRDIRYNPTAAVSLAYPDLDTDAVEVSDDDQRLVNTVVASRPGGATQLVKDDDSRAAYGPYEQALTLHKTSDAQVVAAAQWLVQRYADPPPEMRQMPVEAYSLGTTAYRQLLGLDVSSVATVTDLPAEAPTSSATVTVEGYTESIRQNQHHLNCHVSRTDTATVWVLDSATYSVLDQTTRLAY
ncbi:carbohydrate binding domain-containing protein [Streptomyces lavendulocolor]|uniref:Carbohydrate binding domain-containing protein n=1 Tax=Streptomyces lavendulocolor TaxID=67316 RepID=A0ABV2VY80_9ACTN